MFISCWDSIIHTPKEKRVMEDTLAKLGPWGIAAFLLLRDIIRLSFRRMKGDRRQTTNNNALSKKELKALQEAVVQTQEIDKTQTKLIEYINENGSVPFQNYKAEDEEWKRGADRRFDNHSKRIDSNRESTHAQSERLTKLIAEHEAYKERLHAD